MAVPATLQESFTSFAETAEPRLRAALVAHFGPDRGREATAEALAYGWEHWERIRTMQNPAGYLYRVGQHTGFRKPRRVVFPDVPRHSDPMVEPGLPKAMARLSSRQRAAVVLVHCYEWTPAEVAELLDVSVSTVRNHLDRGMRRLRTTLGGAG